MRFSRVFLFAQKKCDGEENKTISHKLNGNLQKILGGVLYRVVRQPKNLKLEEELR